jgi:hypothetical protein
VALQGLNKDSVMVRTSRADLFQHEVSYKVRKHVVYVILPDC